MNSGEVWKDVCGYEGLYQVSNKGRVKSIYRYRKVLKPQTSNSGYLRVDLFKDKARKQFSIHRLVAIAFLPNPENKPEVNHKDECKTNNFLCNLEWVSRKENNRYGTRRQRQKANTDYRNRKVNNANQIQKASIPIIQYTKNGTFIKRWNSVSDFCRKNNKKSISPIRECCRGKRKTAYGYIFKNEKEE